MPPSAVASIFSSPESQEARGWKPLDERIPSHLSRAAGQIDGVPNPSPIHSLNVMRCSTALSYRLPVRDKRSRVRSDDHTGRRRSAGRRVPGALEVAPALNVRQDRRFCVRPYSCPYSTSSILATGRPFSLSGFGSTAPRRRCHTWGKMTFRDDFFARSPKADSRPGPVFIDGLRASPYR